MGKCPKVAVADNAILSLSQILNSPAGDMVRLTGSTRYAKAVSGKRNSPQPGTKALAETIVSENTGTNKGYLAAPFHHRMELVPS